MASTHPFKQGRLDFFLLSHEMFSMVDNTDILPGYRSDHSIPTVTFAKQTPHRGRGYWKFNNSLLKDTKYIQVVKDAIGEIVKQYAASPYSRENMKYHVFPTIPCLNFQITLNSDYSEMFNWTTSPQCIRGQIQASTALL